MEAVVLGAGADESGGLRAQIANLSVKIDKDVALLNVKIDLMTFWFRIGAFCAIIYLTLFGPPQLQEIIRMFKGKVL